MGADTLPHQDYELGMAEVDIPPEAMKPRRVNPATVLLGMVIVALGIGLVWFGLRQSEKKMTDLERIETQKNIFVLPEKDQIPPLRLILMSTAARSNRAPSTRTSIASVGQRTSENDRSSSELASTT